MINILLEQLYEEIYAPKITPHELIANAKLENYKYVKIYNDGGFLWVESCCRLQSGGEAIFNYKFNEKDHLLCLTSNVDGETNVEYDRAREIEKLRNSIEVLFSRQVQLV